MPNIIGGTDNLSTTEVSGILASTPNYNAIINGNFDFWQSAGPSITSIGGSTGTFYHADMWSLAGQTAVPLVNYVRDTSQIPTTAQSGFYGNSCYANVLNSPSYTAATWSSLYRYAMEGHDLAPLRDRTVTFNFWFRISASAPVGAYSFSLYDPNNNRSYVTTFTPTVGAWAPISITVPMTGFTSAADNSLALEIYIANFAGSAFTTSTTEAWQTGAFFNANTAVNPNITNSHMRLSQFSMTAGNGVGAMGFQRNGRNLADELASCQRYFEKSYDPDTVPGQATTVGISCMVCTQVNGSGTYGANTIPFRVLKRGSPGIAIWDAAGAANVVSSYNSVFGGWGNGESIFGVSGNGVSSIFVSQSSANLSGSGNISTALHWTADARI